MAIGRKTVWMATLRTSKLTLARFPQSHKGASFRTIAEKVSFLKPAGFFQSFKNKRSDPKVETIDQEITQVIARAHDDHLKGSKADFKNETFSSWLVELSDDCQPGPLSWRVIAQREPVADFEEDRICVKQDLALVDWSRSTPSQMGEVCWPPSWATLLGMVLNIGSDCSSLEPEEWGGNDLHNRQSNKVPIADNPNQIDRRSSNWADNFAGKPDGLYLGVAGNHWLKQSVWKSPKQSHFTYYTTSVFW